MCGAFYIYSLSVSREYLHTEKYTNALMLKIGKQHTVDKLLSESSYR
ncbi:MAG: hypothetical protein ACI9C9_002786 [Marivirga sp.]|jgi:hypothetical protein